MFERRMELNLRHASEHEREHWYVASHTNNWQKFYSYSVTFSL